MMTKWTEEQKKAIDTRNCNLLVAAAAGSGKTAVLVERIIRIITDPKNPVDIDKLLVVTFTNAAASEMRERIGNAISERLDKNPDSKVLRRQLTLLGKSSIMTIHAFCLEVIRRNFYMIGLDPDFRIADSTETVLLKQDTILKLFEKKFEEGNDDFLSLAESFGGVKDDRKLQDIVLSLYDFVMSGPFPKKWLKKASDAFNMPQNTENPEDSDFSKKEWGKIIIESMRIELQGILSALCGSLEESESTEGLENYAVTFKEDIENLKELIESLDGSFDDIYKKVNSIEFGKLKSAKRGTPKEITDKVKLPRDMFKDKIKKLKEDIFFEDPKKASRDMEDMHARVSSLCSLVMEFDDMYSSVKRDRGILDFNDLEHMSLDILAVEDEKGNITPSKAAEEYRNYYCEVLVDEYQDSNEVQEVIINMVSRRNEKNPNVFMVGDVKQSIYRFRQAEPELFMEKYDSYSGEEGAKNRKILLYKNFRSRREIIDAVNAVFKSIMSKNIGEINYDKDEALNPGIEYPLCSSEGCKTGGPVEVDIIEKSREEAPEGEYEDINSIQLEARFVGKKIKDLVSKKGETFMVYDNDKKEYRNVQYKDIVILLRATLNWSSVFMEELTKMDIPVFTDTGGGYFDTLEVETVMSLLQIIDNPMQDIPLLAVLRSPVFGFTPEELIDIRTADNNVSFYEALKIFHDKNSSNSSYSDLENKIENFMDNLNKWREKSIHLPVDELIWYLYYDTGYYGYAAAMPGGVQRQANLRILFERAKQYEKTSLKGLFNFINFVDKLRKSSTDMESAKIIGENEDVVRIMSIHKSKGLEFPVVFLSGCGKKFNTQDTKGSILFHKKLGIGPDFVDNEKRIYYPTLIKQAIKSKIRLENLSEEMRVLYVAFTRAKEKLIITGSVNDVSSSNDRWEKVSVMKDEKGKIPEYEVLKSQNYLDWICPVSENQKDKFKINFVGFKDIAESTDKINKKEDYGFKVREEGVSLFKDEIDKRLNYEYPYILSSKLPAKVSVTELKRVFNELREDEYTKNIYKKMNVKKPEFLNDTKGLSGAEKGIVMHSVMQHIALKDDMDIGYINEEISIMVEKEILTKEQADSVNRHKIAEFFKSCIGKRMLDARNKLKREQGFYIYIGSSEIYPELSKEYDDEKIILQGIIDCYFEEDDGIVLIDYKTDRVKDNEDEIRKKYEIQLKYYKRAIERITDKKVKESYIYLFSSGDTLKI